ncbi:MAG: hypothetical protein FWG47_04750 [Propionibacteriaceae bacterium]|nr:hypothetical protein [Propionibacteriaceae bacterium]
MSLDSYFEVPSLLLHNDSSSPSADQPFGTFKRTAEVTQKSDNRLITASQNDKRRATKAALAVFFVACGITLFMGIAVYATLASVNFSATAGIVVSSWANVVGILSVAAFVVVVVTVFLLILTSGSRLLPGITLAISIVGPFLGLVIGGSLGVAAMVDNLQSTLSNISDALASSELPSWVESLVAIFG